MMCDMFRQGMPSPNHLRKMAANIAEVLTGQSPVFQRVSVFTEQAAARMRDIKLGLDAFQKACTILNTVQQSRVGLVKRSKRLRRATPVNAMQRNHCLPVSNLLGNDKAPGMLQKLVQKLSIQSKESKTKRRRDPKLEI